MEHKPWKYFKEVTHHPMYKRSFDTVESILHSICCVDKISWEEAFKRLIHCAALEGTMPDDRHSIRRLLSESGFYLQAGVLADRPVIDIINECNETFNDGEQVIVNLKNSRTYGAYLPIVPVKTRGFTHYQMEYPSDEQHYWTYEVWIRWKDRQDHSIAPRRKSSRTAKKKEMSAKDSDSLVAFNANPTDNIVGDCAVRALAGVLEISWEEAALKLAAAGEYMFTTINLRSNIERCLEREHFEKHGPVKKDGRILTGKEFCSIIHDMFQAGTRLYVYLGRGHAAAIIVFDGDYKIVDTWDSSDRQVTGYWAKFPERSEKQTIQDDTPAIPEKLTEIEVGTKINHKTYGIGEVTDITNAIATIVFSDDLCKKFAVSWILDNCKPV